MVVLRRLLVGLALLIAGVFAAAPQYSVGPISAVDAVVDSIAPQAQALTPSQRIILKRGISPVASWSAATDPFPSTILTHSRTSNATMFDSTGKLTYAPNNLALNTATLGTQSVTVQVGVNYLVSFASGGGSIALSGAGSGTVTSASPVKITATTTTLTLTVTGTVTNAVVAAVTYETTPRTGDQVITTAAAYYGPRIDYDPNTLAVKGLLIEEARTNLAFPSNNFTDARWLGNSENVTVNSTNNAAPDGTNTATNATFTNAAYRYNKAAIANGTYSFTVAVWLSGNIGDKIGLRVLDKASNLGFAQVITLTSTGLARYQASGSITVTTGSYIIFGFENRAGVVPGLSNATVTVGIYGFQIEVGSFATSYIPTAASSVTRAADVVQLTGAALTALRGSAWAFIAEGQTLNTANPVFMGDGTSAFIQRSGGASVSSYNGTSSVGPANFGSGSFAGTFRVGVSSSAAGSSLVANGGPVLASVGYTFTNGASRYLGGYDATASYNTNGWFKSFGVYNQRPSDAALQAKSVVGASYAANDNGVRFAFANDNLPVHWRIAL